MKINGIFNNLSNIASLQWKFIVIIRKKHYVGYKKKFWHGFKGAGIDSQWNEMNDYWNEQRHFRTHLGCIQIGKHEVYSDDIGWLVQCQYCD